MMRLFVYAFLVSFCLLLVNTAQAQIFMNPFKGWGSDKSDEPQTMIAVPQTVSSNGSSAVDQWPTYELVDSPDPWANTSFDKIQTELNYFDPQTGRSYNQYDYMALLAQRGEKGRFNQVAGYLRDNGVFDANKYRVAVNSAQQGGTAFSQDPAAETSAPTAATGVANPQGNGLGVTRQPTINRVFVPDDVKNYQPQKIHRGYDEEEEKPEDNKKRPIFLW